MKEKIKKLPPLFSGALLCAIMMLIVYALKGVWPFGSADITYDDMAQGTLPIYYHIYDWLHGEKAMSFDWYTGLGVNIVNSGTFTPLDLVLCFFKRENLLYALSVLIIVKVMAAAVTANFVFDRLFQKTKPIWKTAFSVLYAMSTYSMFYYTNAFWLDFVIVFPLLIYGLKLLLIDNKPVCYTLFFAYTLFLSVYQGFMVTLAVFFLGGLYLILLSPKDTRAQRTCMLGISTLVGALLSAWHSVPMAIQTLSSKRLQTSFEENESPIKKILTEDQFYNLPKKLILVIGLQLGFVLIAALIFKLLKDKKRKEAVFVFGAACIVLAPVAFENVNLIWHGGSYIGFPMRFFFIAVFTVLCFGMASIDKYGEAIYIPKNKIIKFITEILTLAILCVFIFALYYYAVYCHGTAYDGDTADAVYYRCYYLISCTGIALFILLLCQNKYVARSFCLVLSLIQCFATGYAGIANIHQKESEILFYNNSAFVEYCNEASALNTSCSALGRIKNPDTSLNTNYPFLLKTPALSNWTHNIPQYMQDAAAVLGYSIQYTRILDSGGTAFTDGILGIQKLVQRGHHTATSQYELIEKTENFDLYTNKYAVEFGILADGGLLEDITKTDLSQRFEAQNRLWQLFTDSDEELFEVCTRDYDSENIRLVSATDDVLTFTYTAAQDSVLYMNTGVFNRQVYKTDVNGTSVSGAYNKQTTYDLFPSAAVNGIATLGSFKAGETAEITVSCINGDVFGNDTVQIACMPVEKMTELNALYKNTVSNEAIDKAGLSFDFSNTAGKAKYLFVPITYDKGWSCEINGEKAQVRNALGAYIAVELPEGEGSVTLSFTPQGTGTGIILSTIGAALLLIMLLIMKKYSYKIPKFIGSTVFVLFAFTVVLAIIAVYFIPAGYSAKEYIENFKLLVPEGLFQWVK